ncbi:SPL family radical SAM protein [Vulcanisaeta thermophila]|uniref:SPL family radical SAM protein n=1 Tax=Vulcanisaeta thermophila TaxID=867917 RepID=UPI0008538E8D|nr:radical SAM protein [Vulcanisaeta thermophila]
MPPRVTASLIEELIRRREELKKQLEKVLSNEDVKAALGDHHAVRKPIACGMTIHTGVGCNYGCLYCYVPDMGFPMKPKPYPLTGAQLVYALINNPHIVVGDYGTMLAFGSVTEPFMRETRERTFEYLRFTRDFLGNPTQISTKSHLTWEDSVKLRENSEGKLSVLVTVTTIVNARRLEPGAPSPEERLETIRNLRRLGFHVSLFLRPIIPGVTTDFREVIKRAADAGAVGVVPGSLRVTQGILTRLTAAHFNVSEVLNRMPRRPRDSRDQVPVREGDLKGEVIREAREYNLRVFPSSCSANMDSHGLSCWLCGYGPCGDVNELPRVYDEDMKEIMELSGLKYRGMIIKGNKIIVRVKGSGNTHGLENLLTTVSKRQVLIRRVD